MHSDKFLLAVFCCIDFNNELPFGGFIIDFDSKLILDGGNPCLLVCEDGLTFALMSF